jgi:NCS1 family nucleobase:cation symporter-1
MIPVIYIQPHKIKRPLLVFNVIASTTLIAMMIWSLARAGGGGPLLSQGNAKLSSSELGWSMTSGVTTVIGSIAVGLTNANDYTRFARRPGDQVFGQWFSIMYVLFTVLTTQTLIPYRLFGTLFPLFGCLAASATQSFWGEAIWNPRK